MTLESRVELSLRQATGEEWREVGLSLAPHGLRQPVRIDKLPAEIRVYVVRLHDPRQETVWEPGDDRELTGAGRVFSALLSGLYNGSRLRLCLHPVRTLSAASKRVRQGNRADWWTRLARAEQQLLERLGLEFAFALNPEEVGDRDPQSLPISYWWCPKSRLPSAFGAAWYMGCEGYVVPTRSRKDLRKHLLSAPAGPAVLTMSECRLAFVAMGEGEQMLILSRYLSEHEVRRATVTTDVRRALRDLTRVARFTDWERVRRGPGTGEWWRKGLPAPRPTMTT